MKPSFLVPALVSSSIAGTVAASNPTRPRLAQIEQAQEVASVRTSVVLHDGTHWTIVPTAAILFLPESMTDRVIAKPAGKHLLWPDFLEKNAAWVATDQVTFDQAARAKALPASQAAAWKNQEKLVVAVRHNAPVPVTVGNDLHLVTLR